MSNEVTKEISTTAGIILNTINQGTINLPKLKSFLSRLEQLNAPSSRKERRIKKLSAIDASIK